MRLGYDQALLAEVAGALARAVMHDMRWAVKERHGLGSVERMAEGAALLVDHVLPALPCEISTVRHVVLS